MNFSEIIKSLADARIRFVVIGGVAAAAHGSARVTLDLDICYDPAPDNVERLAALLAEWHAYLRGVEPGLPFYMDARTFRTTPVMTLTTDRGSIDVMDRVPGVGDFDAVLKGAVEVEGNGGRFWVLSLPSLIASKRAAGRGKDRDQLPELEALLALTRDRG